MNTKKLYLGSVLVLALIAFASCGGGSSDRNLRVSIVDPAELTTLVAEDRVVGVDFYDLETGVTGTQVATSTLESSTDGTSNIGVVALPKGDYVMRVKIEQIWDPTSVVVSLTTAVEDPVAVVVAYADLTVSVSGGQRDIIVDLSPGDFALSLDDDGDSLSNLAEILGTTSPLKADTDGDGVWDGLDLFPNLSTEFGDGDLDGVGDNIDNCYGLANADQTDTDGDGDGDTCDSDDDNDGVSDTAEAALGTDPLKADTDGDGSKDEEDNCPISANADQVDTDGDADGNACDSDDDNDGVLDGNDNCPVFAGSTDQADSDGDGTGDVCEGDDDGDGVLDASDNCRTVANADQANNDGDAFGGDVCDPDDDNDGLTDVEETTPGSDSLITNSFSADTDGDGNLDGDDNCRTMPNNLQANSDTDVEGDICDFDDSNPEIVTGGAVFVSASAVNDAGAGDRNHPVKTIAKGIQIAQAEGKKKVFVGVGDYTEKVSMVDGISVYGGFDFSLSKKRLVNDAGDDDPDDVTTIKSDSSPVIVFSNISTITKLEGIKVMSTAIAGNPLLVSIASSEKSLVNNVILENDYLFAPSIASGSVTAVSVTKASPVFLNNVIDAGNSQESTAVILSGSSAKFIHNTIDGGGSATSSTVLQSYDSSPSLVNNILFTEGGNTQRILYFKDANPSPLIVCKNNLIFGIKIGGNNPKLYQVQDPAIVIYTDVTVMDDLVDENAAGGNYDDNTTSVLTNLFVDVDGDNFRLGASLAAVDKGTDELLGVSVEKDHDGTGRPQGVARDLGAFER